MVASGNATARRARMASRVLGTAAYCHIECDAIMPAKRTATARVPLPDRFDPQLATLVRTAPEGDEWLHELKYDGYRIGCRIDRGQVTLLSRRGKDWTGQFPELVAAARKLKVEQALLDGEAAVVVDDGRTSFQA